MAVEPGSILDFLNESLQAVKEDVPISYKLIATLGRAANVSRLVKAYECMMKISNLIRNRAPIEQIRCVSSNETCFESFINKNLPLITENPEQACRVLSNCFNAEFRSFSYQIICNSVICLGQSLKAWKALYDFKSSLRDTTIPFYEQQREKVRTYIERSATEITPLLNIVQLNDVQIAQLHHAQEWLDDAQNVLDSIHQGCRCKINEAQRHCSENGFSAAFNFTAFVIELLTIGSVPVTPRTWTLPQTAAALSITTHAVAVVGDVYATHSANQLVAELQQQLHLIQQLKTEHNALETKLSRMNHQSFINISTETDLV